MRNLTETESSLISRAQRGDRNAYGELVHRYASGVISIVYRMCGDVQLAEDAAQEAFIRGWLHLPSYKPQSPLRNWLYKIAVNIALDRLRKDTRILSDDLDGLSLASAEPDPEIALIQSERQNQVQKAVLSLPPSSRVVLVLREYEGLSYQEIASALEIPIGTVMSRLNFARNRLREILAAELLSVEVEND